MCAVIQFGVLVVSEAVVVAAASFEEAAVECGMVPVVDEAGSATAEAMRRTAIAQFAVLRERVGPLKPRFADSPHGYHDGGGTAATQGRNASRDEVGRVIDVSVGPYQDIDLHVGHLGGKIHPSLLNSPRIVQQPHRRMAACGLLDQTGRTIGAATVGHDDLDDVAIHLRSRLASLRDMPRCRGPR